MNVLPFQMNVRIHINSAMLNSFLKMRFAWGMGGLDAIIGIVIIDIK